MTAPENYADGYTAILRNPRLYKDPYWGVERATGNIFDDRRGSFYDGQTVHYAMVAGVYREGSVEHLTHLLNTIK